MKILTHTDIYTNKYMHTHSHRHIYIYTYTNIYICPSKCIYMHK